MKNSPRFVAFSLLIDAEARKFYRLNSLLEEATQKLDDRDKRFVFELVYGVTRWQGSLDFIIGKLSRTPTKKIKTATQVLLRMGLYQIFEMNKTPLSAAVNETVKLAKAHHKARHFAGFINGTLRGAIRKTDVEQERKSLTEVIDSFIDETSSPSLKLSIKNSFPGWLTEKWINHFGLETATRLMQKSNERASTFFRLNSIKISRDDFEQKLPDWEMEAKPVKFAKGLYRLTSGKITPDAEPVFKGYIQPQDAASFLAVTLLNVKPDDIVADICCGKGIKSGALANAMQNRGFIFCVDKSTRQLDELTINMKRLGVNICHPIIADTTKNWPTTQMFEKIIVDAPCSGTGTLRRHPEGKWNKTAELIEKMTKIQQETLHEGIKHLAPGGTLVYSVCSIEPEEGVYVVDQLLEKYDNIKRDKIENHRFITEKGDLFILPGDNNMNGFYATRLIKTK